METRVKRRARSPYEYANTIYAGNGFVINLNHGNKPSTTAYIYHHALRSKLVKNLYAASMLIDGKLYILAKRNDHSYSVTTVDPETGNDDDLNIDPIPDCDPIPANLTFWVFTYNHIALAQTPTGYRLFRVVNMHEYFGSRIGYGNIYHWRAIPRAYLTVDATVKIHYLDGRKPTVFPIYAQFRVMQHNILIRHDRPARDELVLSEGRYEHAFERQWLADVAQTLIKDMPERHYLLGTPEIILRNSRDGLRHNIDVYLYRNYYHGYDDSLVHERIRLLGCITIDYAHLPWLYHILEDPGTYFCMLPREILDVIAQYLLPPSVYVATTNSKGKYRIHGKIAI